MLVPVVNVGKMDMLVCQRRMPVRVAVPRTWRHRRIVRMFVMEITGSMLVFVRVLQ